uniref:F-box domain-containing protein n=1 Tax=Fagus sylvatica TaxID=28930 RepID=A0A2N9F7W4_FAGSY
MVDRISNLPDSLLSHILSFLKIKEYVATSILSSRWKLVWTLVPIVEFDANEFKWKSSSSDKEQSPNQHQDQSYRFRFAHIVSRFCALRNGNPIQKFRLLWRSLDYDPIHVDTWIRATIACGLEELDLAICSGLLATLSTCPLPACQDSASSISEVCKARLFLEFTQRTTQYAQDESSITHEWIRLLDVPKCLLSHLSAFHFKGFKGFNDELELVREILKWARVLKKMTISSYPLDSREEGLCSQGIIDVPKAVCDL